MMVKLHRRDLATLHDALDLYEYVQEFWLTAQHSTEAERDLARLRILDVQALRGDLATATSEGPRRD
jgi:hypothetical protein